MEQPIGEVSFLARSETRVRLLEEIYEHGTLEKRDLKERVEASRTTIQRNLDALEERGWIEGDFRTYSISQSGKPVTEQFLKLLNTVHAAKRLQPFLECISVSEFDLEFHLLATADITVSDENDPYAPVNRHIELMQSANRFRCLLPAIGLQPMLVARDCIVERGSTHEVVIDPAIVDTLRSDSSYREVAEEILRSGRADVLVSEASIPFYLGLADGVVQVGVSDESGAPQSLVESESTDAQQWAERKYTEFKTTAEPLLSQWPNRSLSETDSR